MDFFERYLGISPDSGDGSMEVIFLLVVAATTVAITMHVRYRK